MIRMLGSLVRYVATAAMMVVLATSTAKYGMRLWTRIEKITEAPEAPASVSAAGKKPANENTTKKRMTGRLSKTKNDSTILIVLGESFMCVW